MSIFIGGAWPYANGSLHLGHLAALLPGDVIARYFRLKGEEVLYVSGSDCHGTPISIRAKNEKVSPSDITDRYHEEFSNCFERLGFSYDLYSRTDDEYHKKEVKKLFKELYDKGYIYSKTIEQLYCTECNQFLPDRFVEGICPHCGSTARGDQCDACSSLLDPVELKDRKCKNCGSTPEVRSTEQLFLALSSFQQELENYISKAKENGNFRINAVNNSERYLREGLRDRAVSRDLSWGIDVPIKGFEDKKIYVWIDAVLGYITASRKWAEENNRDWKKYWNKDTISYYIHGKDNIPFHTIILPALLEGIGNLNLPDKIISSEYLTLEGRKLSTSNNWAVWAPYIIEKYNADAIRYFLIINGPERRDTDFSWREFINRNNGELLGAYGNLVNRTLVFAKKYFNNEVPEGAIDKDIEGNIKELYKEVGEDIEQGECKSALEKIFKFVRDINKYFDEEKPWITINENKESCAKTIYTCIAAIANLSNLLETFLPFSSEKIKEWFSLEETSWKYIEVDKGLRLKDSHILFKRIDKKNIEDEFKKLGNIFSNL